MMWYLLAVLVSLGTIAQAGNYTVTEEVWFDIEVLNYDGPGEDFRGRFVVAVFGETAPMTALNFVSLARGYQRSPKARKLSYKNSLVHRVVQDFVVQMGDITKGDGSGGISIYGERFNDEEFILSHRSAGWVAMANHGPDTNSSQFYILLTKARWLDGKHVVFGKVIRGFFVVETMGEIRSDPHTAVPSKEIRIVDCGLNNIKQKYDLQANQLDLTQDL